MRKRFDESDAPGQRARRILDKKTGKVILERIVDKYPQSSEAKQAEKKIAEIAPKVTAPPKKTKK